MPNLVHLRVISGGNDSPSFTHQIENHTSHQREGHKPTPKTLITLVSFTADISFVFRIISVQLETCVRY
ncbi:hypothetical protein Hanom_Chr01g00059701 [Helianthus anomalus]